MLEHGLGGSLGPQSADMRSQCTRVGAVGSSSEYRDGKHESEQNRPAGFDRSSGQKLRGQEVEVQAQGRGAHACRGQAVPMQGGGSV